MPFILFPDEQEALHGAVSVQNPFLETIAKTRKIQDADGSDIVDDTGLVSATSFPFGSVNKVDTRDITSTSFVDVADTEIEMPELARETNVLIIINALAALSMPDSDVLQIGEIVLNIDGDNQLGTTWDQAIRDMRLNTGGLFDKISALHSLTGADIISLAAGTHTLKLQAKVNGQTLKITQTSIIYIILGT